MAVFEGCVYSVIAALHFCGSHLFGPYPAFTTKTAACAFM